jgi:uncharacterized protein YlxP (DUF503 family)
LVAIIGRKKRYIMNNIKEELKKQFDVEVEENDTIEYEHNYMNHMIVDVIVTDAETKEQHTFQAFNLEYGKFPY